MDIAVHPVDPADPVAMDARTAIIAAARAHDVPDFPPVCPLGTAGRLRVPSSARDAAGWLGYLDGVPVAALSAWLPRLDNLGTMEVELVVDPGYRRRGVGTVLYRYAIEQARERERVRLEFLTSGTLPGGVPRDEAGHAFATVMGAKPALANVRRRLDLSTVDIVALDPTPAPGYSLVFWRDRAPDEYVDDVARLDGRLFLDSPNGDLVIEAQQVDAARIRDGEAAHAARGERTYHCGVRHDATGALVAWTTLMFAATVPDHAWQQITIVDPDHRGHRLGFWIKVANLRYALDHEPALRIVDTWNATANAHMIAINEEVGFRAVDHWDWWQHELR